MIRMNPLVTLLAQYCPSTANEAAFDESVQTAAERLGIRPLEIPPSILPLVLELLQRDDPANVILTGTAGDGKTHICRKVYQHLNNHRERAWGNPIVTARLASGKKLVIVKDFTELGDRDQARVLARLLASLFGEDGRHNEVFLIAANEGILTRKTTWNELPDFCKQIVTNRQWLERLHDELTDMLAEGRSRSNKYNLSVFDLSLSSSTENLKKVLEAILKHEAWLNCEECSARTPESKRGCPVFENRKRLLNPLVQKRLQELVELCEFNNEHLTMRHLLMLVANALVGNSQIKGPVPAISSCEQIITVLEQDPICGAYFQNIFGENLPRGRKVSPFSTLSALGVGKETSNRIDNILVYGDLDDSKLDDYKRLVSSDQYYGETETFRLLRERYREDEPGDTDHKFLHQLTAQRRRLYFEMPDDLIHEYRHNELTVYHSSHEYRSGIIRVLEQGYRVQGKYIDKLVCGLNRVFVGALLEETDCLLLATSGTTSQARISDVLIYKLPNDPLQQTGVFLEWDSNLKVPILVVKYGRDNILARRELTLARYEFLTRVADGALPGSFSAELYEDILAFKAQIIRRFLQVIPSDTFAEIPIQLITVESDGRVSVTSVELPEV